MEGARQSLHADTHGCLLLGVDRARVAGGRCGGTISFVEKGDQFAIKIPVRRIIGRWRK